MFDSSGRLDIFENFIIDRKLPKHLQTTQQELMEESFGDSGSIMMSNRQFVRSRMGGTSITVAGNTASLMVNGLEPEPPFKGTWLQRILIRLLYWVSPKGKALVFRPLTDAPRPPPEITVAEFFSSIKDSQDDLEVVDGRARGYEAALERARRTGQVALAEQLEAGIEAVRAETQLHAMGLDRVLTEETLVSFVKKSPRGLRLDWVRNFTRHIPDDVLTTKTECDERRIFDNYVVLHYDPDAKSWAETQQEAAARRDPILFGVIEGRRVLYFVGEWTDEFCDLSLDQIADVLFEGMDVRPSEATERLDPEAFNP